MDINVLAGLSKQLHVVCTNVIWYCDECALFARKNTVV